MKKYFTLVLFTLITTISFGQNNYEDVVYLKNGSIIRGIIIEQVPNKSIKIQTADRNVFVFKIDEVERMTREPLQSRRTSTTSSSGMRQGYKGIFEIGYEIGTGDFGIDRLKLNIINGYQINPVFSIGFGTGLRYYFDADVALMPIFANVRTYFIDHNVTPYLSLDIGYAFNASKRNFEGVGFLMNPTIGASYMISNRSAMNFGIGYGMQRIERWGVSAISINFGISY